MKQKSNLSFFILLVWLPTACLLRHSIGGPLSYPFRCNDVAPRRVSLFSSWKDCNIEREWFWAWDTHPSPLIATISTSCYSFRCEWRHLQTRCSSFSISLWLRIILFTVDTKWFSRIANNRGDVYYSAKIRYILFRKFFSIKGLQK
jgi:hypothetical protein